MRTGIDQSGGGAKSGSETMPEQPPQHDGRKSDGQKHIDQNHIGQEQASRKHPEPKYVKQNYVKPNYPDSNYAEPNYAEPSPAGHSHSGQKLTGQWRKSFRKARSSKLFFHRLLPLRKTNPTQEMTILEHLAQARRRLVFALVGISIGTIVGWFTYEWVVGEITAPLSGRTPLLFSLFDLPFYFPGSLHLSLNFTTVAGAFDLKFKVALWTGIIISSPWWLSQIWIYIAPGLRRQEKLYLVTFGIVAWVLFTLGILTGMWVAPQAVVLLAEFTPAEASNFISANSYFSFYMTLVFFFGVTTLIPEFLVALNFLGLLSARSLLKGWRIAVIGSFTFAAITNPIPNPTSMIVQGLGLCLLYLLALAIAGIHDWRLQKQIRQRAKMNHANAARK